MFFVGSLKIVRLKPIIEITQEWGNTARGALFLRKSGMFRKFVMPLIILVVGSILSYWSYAHFYGLDLARAQEEFDRRADNVASVISEGVQGYTTAIENLRNFTTLSIEDRSDTPMTAVEDPEKYRDDWEQIKNLTRSWTEDTIASYPGFRGLGWAVYSSHENLPALEAAGKALITTDFEIKELLSGDALGEVAERDAHFPVFYLEPLELNQTALGVDMAGATVTREVIVEARDTGAVLSTPVIPYIERRTGQKGFNVYRAVYFNEDEVKTVEDRRDNLYAMAFGVIIVDDLLDFAMRGLEEEGIDFFMYTHHDTVAIASGTETPVYVSNRTGEAFLERQDEAERTGIHYRAVINVVGRDWSLYCFQSDNFLPGLMTNSARNVSLMGLLLTVLLSLYLFQLANRTQGIEALVEKRTIELSRSNLKLEREMASRIEADEHREELESQLLQSQKMESIGQLAGGIAHDFNNLLVAILGYSELTLTKLDKESPIYGNVEQVMRAGERAKVLVRQLLAFSRQQVLQLADTDLNTVLVDLAKMIERVIGEHITLHVIENRNLPIVRADRGQVEQIVLNLCVNSRDAMVDGGILTIETSERVFDEEFCENHGWARPGTYVMLSVTDTGSGMDEETQHRIFDPFFTTKKMGEGTGLGLSTVFGLVSQHKGMIDVSSVLGEGSTFKIYFPAAGGEERLAIGETIEVPEDGDGTILFADDDELVRGVTERMLTDSGYTIISARDGVEAIELFDQHRDEIDLALLDVVMPRMGGRVVAEHIHSEKPDLPTLFSSGYSNDAIHTNFILETGMHFIQKPYHREELLLKIRELLKERN
jgi:signal transduction histidine kinase/ActR/RegA family two-component response regulator